MMLTCPAGTDMDLRGWKVVIGGSALPMALARAAIERGIDVFAGYGMSETCPILTLAHLPPRLQSHGCRREAVMPLQGRPADPVGGAAHRRRRDGATSRTMAQSAGEIVVRAPWLTQGYLKNPSARRNCGAAAGCTPATSARSTNGYLKIIDRIKDVIKTGGEWVSSLEIEDMISQHPAVSEVGRRRRSR